MELIRKSAFGHVKTLMNLNALLAFSELQIVDNCCEALFYQDVMAVVEMWDMCHAKKCLMCLVRCTYMQ